MIDIQIRVEVTGEVYGPFETWEGVLRCAHGLLAQGVGELTIFRENFVCDFCSTPSPAWGYDAEDAALMMARNGDEPEIHVSRGAWAACDTCHDLIECGEWGLLLRRTVESFHSHYAYLDFDVPPDVVGEFAAQAHMIFRATRTDDPPAHIPTDAELLGCVEEKEKNV